MGKRKRVQESISEERNEDQDDVPDEPLESGYRYSDQQPSRRGKWTNKQRVLIFGSRGITHRDRHLMNNFREMLPHSKPESKLDPKDPIQSIDEICTMKNCNKCVFFENKKRKDLYMWISNVGRGPSFKFLVENVHTMEELKMTGNCLKGSRPLLSFDPQFEKSPHFTLIKELLTQTFGTPLNHPKSQPFIDHVFTFTLLDDRIWFRNYQIVEEDGSLAEVGPRFCLNLIKIFDGSFGGAVLYSNSKYVSPNKRRQMMKAEAMTRYKERVVAKHGREINRPDGASYKDLDRFDDVFETIAASKAKGVQKTIFGNNQ